MKVLFISNMKNMSGWSTQACNHILALDSADIDVVPRHLNLLDNVNKDLHPRILELEQKNDSSPDLIILNTLPSLYERQGDTKYLSFSMTETSNFKAAGWQHKLNMMDACIAPNFYNKQSFLKSGVTKPIHIVPLAIDTNQFKTFHTILQIRQDFPESFIFYTIGELTRRKNIETILRAYYTEFSEADPVVLFIKTTPTGLGDNPRGIIEDLTNKVKAGLKINKYPRSIINCGFSSEKEINSLHQYCDAYITASHGEAFNIPLATAMLAGRVVIAPNHSGMDYVTDKNAYVVQSREQSCFGATDTLPDIYTGYETWYDCSVPSIMECMRSAFEKRDLNRKKIENAKKDIQKFSIENVGELYKKVLESIV